MDKAVNLFYFRWNQSNWLTKPGHPSVGIGGLSTSKSWCVIAYSVMSN